MQKKLKKLDIRKTLKASIGFGVAAVVLCSFDGRVGFAQLNETAPVGAADSARLYEASDETREPNITESVDEVNLSLIAGDYEDAIQRGLKCLRHPGFDQLSDELKVTTLRGICLSYNKSGHPEMGAHLSILFGHIFQDDSLPHLIRADALRSMKQFRAEREALIHALNLSPDSTEIRIRLARSMADWPGSTEADGDAALRILAPLLEDTENLPNSVQFHDAIAIAAAVSGKKSLAHQAAVNALTASDADGASERSERLRLIQMGEPVQPAMTPVEHILNPTYSEDYFKNAVLSLALEGIVRFKPDDQSLPTRHIKLTREFPGVLVGPLGLVLTTSRLIDLPTDVYPDHEMQWESPPEIMVYRRDSDSGRMMQAGTAVIRTLSTSQGLAVLDLRTEAEYSTYEGLIGWTPVTIAPDYRLESMLKSPAASQTLHIVAFDSAIRATEVLSLPCSDALELLNKIDLAPGTPVFNDSGELMMIVNPSRETEESEPVEKQNRYVVANSDECSFVYNCLTTYGIMPARQFPVPVRLIRRESDTKGESGLALEVEQSSSDGHLKAGDQIVKILTIPIDSPLIADTFLRIAHESFIENIDVELADGRTVSIPLLAHGVETPKTSSPNEQQSVTPATSFRQQLSQWLIDNVLESEAIRVVESQAAKAESEGMGMRTVIGANLLKGGVAIVQFDRSGTLVIHHAHRETAGRLGIEPNSLSTSLLGKNFPRIDSLFSIEGPKATPAFRSFSETGPEDRGLEVTFDLKCLKKVENDDEILIRIETGNGGFSAMYEVSDPPLTGESKALRLEINPEELSGPLPDSDFMFFEVCIRRGDKTFICGSTVYQVFNFE